MIGIKYDSLADLNGQAIAWCNKVNGKEHGTTGKDCLISYNGNQYSVPSEYAGRDLAVVALGNMLAVYHEGKQVAIHRQAADR